jgi:kumamolisin
MKNCTTIFHHLVLALGLTGGLIAGSAAYAGLPYPTAATPRAIDLGELNANASRTPISVTVALSLPRLSDAESLMQALNTPGSTQYRQFLSASEFEARFAPSSASVARVIASLARYGLTSERTTATTLRVTGLPADMERAFTVSLHSYEVPAHDNVEGYTFHAPLSRATVPSELAGLVAGVVGLDGRPSLHPHHYAASPKTVRQVSGLKPGNVTNPFGLLTVADFAQQYGVLPLYNHHIVGTGKTVGIMTFANFTPSDAFVYWSAVGLTVNPNRITVVPVDGGAGPPSDASGSDETTLDVEQSGGVAPGASVIVYHAPNTNQAFVDVVAKAVSDNIADSLSISWGEWEWFDNLENSPVIDPFTGHTVGVTQAVHELLVRAAIQGQSVFTSSGDGGAYEANHDLYGLSGDPLCYGPYTPSDPSSCSLTLSVDYPASDTAITASGGTTLPGIQEYCLNAACTPPYYVINIAHEQVWGWDYLEGLCTALGFDPISCGIYGVGSGGGVSIMFGLPWYQLDLAGVQASRPGQLFRDGSFYQLNFGIPPSYKLPAHYQGRNVPDISANADPQTGYSIYYTSSSSGFVILTFIGGTSFVAPQLNGVAALLGQDNGGRRVGLLNFALYGLAQGWLNDSASDPAIRTISRGDNWFYHGRGGYSPAAGLGTLDVEDFANALRGFN